MLKEESTDKKWPLESINHIPVMKGHKSFFKLYHLQAFITGEGGWRTSIVYTSFTCILSPSGMRRSCSRCYWIKRKIETFNIHLKIFLSKFLNQHNIVLHLKSRNYCDHAHIYNCITWHIMPRTGWL